MGPASLVNTPAMPGEARGYQLVGGPVADSVAGSVDYRYARGVHSVDVSLMPYDTTRGLRVRDDTLDLLYTEYSIAFDTLYSLADRNRVKINFYFHREDDLHFKGHTYRGYAMRWAWKSQDGHQSWCNGSFVMPTVGRLGWSCYQQTYTLPEGLLRVRAELNTGEGAANGELRGLANEFIGAIESPKP